MSNRGAEQIRTLGVYFFFDPLVYTSSWCILDVPPTDEGSSKMELTTLKESQLIAVYRKLRERRDEAKKKFTEEQRPTLELMERIETELMSRMESTGANSIACDSGTAYKASVTSVVVRDWSAFFEFVRNNEAFDMLERRASKSAVVDYAETNGELPPGLSMSVEESVNVRAPKGA